MIIYPTSQFKKSYKKLPNFIKKKAEQKDKIFRQQPFDSVLVTHKPSGKLKKFWSYSVDKNYLVLFRFENKNIARIDKTLLRLGANLKINQESFSEVQNQLKYLLCSNKNFLLC